MAMLSFFIFIRGYLHQFHCLAAKIQMNNKNINYSTSLMEQVSHPKMACKNT